MYEYSVIAKVILYQGLVVHGPCGVEVLAGPALFPQNSLKLHGFMIL